MKVYLDNNATTMVAPEALEVMLPLFSEGFGNASSFHTFGSQAKEAVEQARQSVAALLGAEASEIVFTSCGTESDNWALKSVMEEAGSRSLLLTSSVEHPAVLEVGAVLSSRGYGHVSVGVDSDGQLRMDEYEVALKRGPALVSIMAANNETGVIFPLRELAALAHESGALFHTDAVQAVGKIPLNVHETGIDLLSLSGHKFHGPKGVGALYIREGIGLLPRIHGGHQERGMRAGTYNSPGIAGLGKASELAAATLGIEREQVRRLRDRLERGIQERCPSVIVVGQNSDRLPNTLTALFEAVESEAILMLLDLKGICASSGSACSTGSKVPSHVLKSMGVPDRVANSAIRFSLSRYTTPDDIEYTLEAIEESIGKLRKISPYAD